MVLALCIQVPVSAQISSFEYFFDTDPGIGNATPVITGFTPGAAVSFTKNIPVTGLGPGFHTLYLRAKSNTGLWGHHFQRVFYMTTIGGPDIAQAEYFFDTDPGRGNGQPLSINTGSIVSQTLSVPVNGLTSGFHQLYIRVKNTDGVWGQYQTRSFLVTNAATGNGDITAIEYFFDSDPGKGNGTSIPVSANSSVSQVIAIPASGLTPGFHQLYLRAKNTQQIWSHYQTRSFIVAPVTTGSGKIAAAEYFVDNDPGNGNGTAIAINPPIDSVDQTFMFAAPAGLTEGIHQLYIRVKNEQGKWSMYQRSSFTVKPPRPGSGYALSFDGSDDGVDVHFTNAPHNTFTYEMWVNPSNTISIVSTSTGGVSGNIGQRWVVVPSYGTSATAGIGISVGTNGIQVFEHGPSYLPALLSWNHTVSGWTHVAVVYTNKQPSLYVNGMLVATGLTSNRDTVFAVVGDTTSLGSGIYGNYAGQLDEVRLWQAALPAAQVKDWMCRKLSNSHPLFSQLTGSFNFDENAGSGVGDDFKSSRGELKNGTVFVTSGAPLGNTSAHSYTGAAASVTLAHPTRGDAVTATLTSGNADGIHIYCVTDTPNHASGTTCLGSNDGYFGVFTVNGTDPAYDVTYNYTGLPLNALSESQVKLFSRADNSSLLWTDRNATIDTALNTLDNNDSLRGEYIVSNAVVAPFITIAGSDDTICAGTQVTFTANISNGGTLPVYQWKKNNIPVGSNSSTYTDNTLINGDLITCELTSNSTCVSPSNAISNSVTITVTSGLTASVSITAVPGNTICAGTQVTYTATPVNGGNNPVYQWKVNHVPIGGNANTFTSSSFSNGDMITCEMAINASCVTPATAVSSPDTLHVAPVVVPAINIASNAGNSICRGVPVTFTATVANEGSTPVFQWKKNNINVGGNTAGYVDSALNNNDIITCQLISNANCANPAQITSNPVSMTVYATEAPTISIYSNTGNTICTGTVVTFIASSSNGGTSPVYQWKKNNTNVGTNNSQYEDTALNDQDIITCELTSSNTCAQPLTALSNTVTMTVNAYTIPSMTISADAGNNICHGATVIFTANPVHAGSSPTYQWKKNNVNVGTNSAVYTDHNLAGNDTIYCVLTSSYACTHQANAGSNHIVMTVHPLPAINAGADQTILQGSSVVLSASDADNYTWNTGDTTASIIVTPAMTTSYVVSTVNGFSCSNTDTVRVTVNYSALSVSPGSYNYGNVVANTPASTNITIHNNGTITEAIDSITVAGAFSTSFSTQTVTAGSSIAIPVTFTPTGMLIYQQTATIHTTAGSFSVILQGRGVSAAPSWTITPAAYSFANTQLNDSSFHTFVINNTGNIPVSIDSISTNNIVFTGLPVLTTIPVGGFTNIIGKFKPSALTGYSGALTIHTSTPALTPLQLNLTGNGYLPGTPPVLQFATSAPYNGTSGVDRTVGGPGAYVYRVVYKQANNLPPQTGYPQVGIDMNADGDFIDAGEGIFSMSKVGSSTDWINGETFTYTVNLSATGNQYGYRFMAKDSLGNVATATNTAYVAAPHVTNQTLDLSIYANDITFSNNNPAVGQQFTVSAVVHNNSPYSASNVPVRFYKDSIYLTSTTLPYISANSTATLTENFTFPVDGFYPVKVWIDSANTLGETNPLNNYAIRPVIVGHFTVPGTIHATSNAITQSCPGTAVTISGNATYSGLNLAGNPPVLGATVTVQIAGGPTLTTNTVTGGYWNVYYNGFACNQPRHYTVTITDYTLTSAATPGTFNAPCITCTTPTYYYVTPSGSVAGGCIREHTAFNYDINLVNDCHNDTAVNDTTYVYANGILTYTHTQSQLPPCQSAQYHDVFTLPAGTHTLSFTNVYYDTTGRHEHTQSSTAYVQPSLPDLYLGGFSQTGSTSFTVNDINGTCIPSGAHKVYLYDSVAHNTRLLLDSFAVSGVNAEGYQQLVYSRPSWPMGYHYLKLVTDVYDSVTERNESNNELNALLYVPFPELSVSGITVSNTNIGPGSVVNYAATVQNTGSSAAAFKVQFFANGIPIGNRTLMPGLSSGASGMVISDAYTVQADSCPVAISVIADVDHEIAELTETNNADSIYLAIDLVSGTGCNGLGSSCNPYVITRNTVTHFTSSVSNTGTRDAGSIAVKFSVNGQKIAEDQIAGVPSQASVSTGLYHSFSAIGNYMIQVSPDSANTICELHEDNNMGAIYIHVVEGLPDLEILSQHISPGNLNPAPGQSISVVASVFNKGNQTAAPTKIRLWVDNVQLGSDIQIDSLLPGRDTSVLATATYSSATVGPKIIRVKTDALDEINEIREDNNEATRAIIVGGAPDLAHSLHEAITFSAVNFREQDTVTIRNYLRNYGGDQGTAWLRFTVTDSMGMKVFTDSIQFTLLSNDSMMVTKSWVVNMAGKGLVTTEILRSNPQEFNELNNTDTLSFTAGPALIPVIATHTPALCEGQRLKLTSAITKDAQAVAYEWYHNNISTGVTTPDSLIIANATLNDSGTYTLLATDYFGTETAAQPIVIHPVLIPSVSITAYPGNVICKGSSVKFSAIPVNGGPVPAYQWKKNGFNVGNNSNIYRDSVLESNDVITCTMISNAPCTSTLPVAANVVTMTVNSLAGSLAGSSASQTFDVDSGMRFNYTDNSCRLIATVTTTPGTDLGPTTATTSINPSLTGFVQRFTEITPTYNLPAIVKLYFLPAEFAAYNSTASANGQPLLPVSHNDPAVNNMVVYQYHGLPSGGTTGPGGMYDANNITVIPSSSISKVWNDVSGYWEISFPVTGFSGHFLKAENQVPLAITLGNITATNHSSTNHISWNTLHETGGDDFGLERSHDGRSFTAMATIKGKGQAAIYSYDDEQPFSGINYYRLRMYDNSGRSTFSKVVTATVKAGTFIMNVFPNPASDNITITTENTTGKGEIQLTDVAGTIIYTVAAGPHKTIIDVSRLAPGVYFVKYHDEGSVHSARVVKQ